MLQLRRRVARHGRPLAFVEPAPSGGNRGRDPDVEVAMNLVDHRTCGASDSLPAPVSISLDRWSRDQLDVATTALIVLDHAGRIVAMSPTAARWFGVSAWQVRGRALLGELGWAIGPVATERVAEFLGSTVRAAATRAVGRRGSAVDLELLRGRDRVYLSLGV